MSSFNSVLSDFLPSFTASFFKGLALDFGVSSDLAFFLASFLLSFLSYFTADLLALKSISKSVSSSFLSSSLGSSSTKFFYFFSKTSFPFLIWSSISDIWAFDLFRTFLSSFLAIPFCPLISSCNSLLWSFLLDRASLAYSTFFFTFEIDYFSCIISFS